MASADGFVSFHRTTVTGAREAITREDRGGGVFGEVGSRTAGHDADGGTTSPAHWGKSYYPTGEAGELDERHSVEIGQEDNPDGTITYYTIVRVDHADGSSDALRGEYTTNGDVGSASVHRNADQSWDSQSTITHTDGSYDVTTRERDPDGDGSTTFSQRESDGTVKREGTTQVEGDKSERDDDDPHKGGDPDDPDDPDWDHPPGDLDSPTGDGEPGAEGNPDSVLQGLSPDAIRRIIGHIWGGDDEPLDNLGGAGPWADRMRHMALAGGSGHGGDGEALDTLGKPGHVFHVTTTGHDAGEKLDTLGSDFVIHPPGHGHGLDTASLMDLAARTARKQQH